MMRIRERELSSKLEVAFYSGDLVQAATLAEGLSPQVLCRFFRGVRVEEEARFFELLPRAVESEVFRRLSLAAQKRLIESLAHNVVSRLITAARPDDRTALLGTLPESVCSVLMELLPALERRQAEELLSYPEESVGRLMTPHFVDVPPEWTVDRILSHIREEVAGPDALNVIYVTTEVGVLIGEIRMSVLLTSDVTRRADTLLTISSCVLEVESSRLKILEAFNEHPRSALPVVDGQQHLLGIVTFDDVFKLQRERQTETLQKAGGSEFIAESYFKMTWTQAVRQRGGWLVLLFVGEMLTATAMGYFVDEIAKAVVLALFVPLIISSGGNSGSQATTMIIRAMALGEVKLNDWWRVMRREVLSGLSLGVILGAIGFLRITIWSQFSTIYGEHWLLVALTVAFALVGVVAWGSLLGSMIPFALRSFKIDPAVSSAPFVATLVDVSGLIIYFTIAAVILKGVLI